MSDRMSFKIRMTKCVKIKVSGRVQGVFFRYSAKAKADEIGIKGFARNTPDNGVEIVAQGNEENLNELIEWCRKGPDLAKVEKIDVSQETSPEEFPDFSVR